MLDRLFRRRPARVGAETLYAAAVAQARQPVFYAELGVPDRIDARFELYTLHVLLLILRLRDEGRQGVDMAQDLFDAYVSALDNTLRELGVGDVSVGKKMRALGEAVYGRMTAYEAAIRAGDRAALSQALARNVFEGEAATPAAQRLADYALGAHGELAAQPFETASRAPGWPRP